MKKITIGLLLLLFSNLFAQTKTSENQSDLTKPLSFLKSINTVVSSTVVDNTVPYLQSPTDTSIWISWKSGIKRTSRIAYGVTNSNLTDTLSFTCDSLANNFYYNSVYLNNLTPSQAYYYQLLMPDSVSPIYRFVTQPKMNNSTGHYRILLWGDHQLVNSTYDNKWREDTLFARAISKAEELYGAPIEDCINVIQCDGDQVDAGTLSFYENEHFRIGGRVSPNVPMMTCLGNHETYYDNALTNYKNLFKYDNINYGGITSPGGELYYSYQEANIVFIVANTEDNSTTQTNWVKQVVDAANADSNIDWIISVGHRPYNCEQYVGDYSEWFRKSIMPILATSNKYVLHIGAHHHLYHRGQTRDWPIYHICAGGAAWDQYWGQSTEQDMDDIQKTIANWAYQIIDFDLDNRTMEVNSYAIGHPLLGVVYDDKLIDTFHRKLGIDAPEKPSLNPVLEDTITLPYTFVTSDYNTSTNEVLNSTQFQISKSNSFIDLEEDVICDIEDLYGDTGNPDYLPIDINANINILNYTVNEHKITNGPHYIRARHRDNNAEWSSWSDTLKFVVKGSTDGNPEISISKSVYSYDESIAVNYTNGTGNSKDWIGIYYKGDTPGSGTGCVGSIKWSYVSGISGQISFSGLTNNKEYFIAYFANDGYEEIAPRQTLYIGSTPTLTTNKEVYSIGDSTTVSYSNAPGQSTDWLGIYKVGTTPNPTTSSLKWSYVNGEDGSYKFKITDKGYYYATYMVDNGYTEITERVNFQIGDTIVELSMDRDTFDVNEDMVVNFSNGPGGSKDYIGIFTEGGIPGIDPLITYKYVDGEPEGSVTITDSIPFGDYFMAFYPNDSYTQISPSFHFTIGKTDSITGLKTEIAKTFDMSIYPNPSDGIINLHINNINKNKFYTIKITDMFGRTYLVQQYNDIYSTIKIDLSALSPDIYNIIVISEDNYQSRRVIVK